MAKTFVKDPRTIVKPGDIVRVKVLEVDRVRKRISLTMRLDDEVGPPAGQRRGELKPSRSERPLVSDQGSRSARQDARPGAGTALGEALRRAGLNTGSANSVGRGNARK